MNSLSAKSFLFAISFRDSFGSSYKTNVYNIEATLMQNFGKNEVREIELEINIE